MKNPRKMLIDRLTKLGLSINEAKAYETLIELGVAAPLEIASASGVPVSKIYLILSELERKGLIEVQHGRPKLYRPVEPKRALRLLTEEYLKIEKEALELIDRISGIGRNLNTGTFWVVKGKRNIVDKIRYLLDNAQYSLAIAAPDKLIVQVSNNLQNAIENNVNVSLVIYKTNTKTTKYLVDDFRRDAMVKVREILAPSMFIVDDHKALTYITATLYRGIKRREEIALLVEDEDFLPVFSAYFKYTAWYSSKLVSDVDEFLSKPRTYCIYFRAVEDVAHLLSKGIKPFARVQGWHITNTREKVVLEGRIVKAYQSPDKTVYNLTLVSDNGKTYMLGGKRCVIEDVETEIITIYPNR